MVTQRYGRDDFGRVLNEARQAHNLSVRDAARIAGVPFGTLQGWLSGRHFPVPALRANCLRLLEALELTDAFEPNFWNRDIPAARGPRRAMDAPYLGLRPFGTGDAPLFHGRDDEVRRLAEAIASAQPHGLIAVIGASGSGKSSLLAAGIVAGECVDGDLKDHRAQLTGPEELESVPADTTIVIIDQFDSVLAEPEGVRATVLDRVASLAERCIVVLALRSDAFAAASAEPLLNDALTHPFLVSRLSRAELTAVVTGPAAAVGVRVDPDLVRLLLDELAPGDTVAPGALPLLSQALLATWAAGRGASMTVADYYAAGGVASAVDDAAEAVFGSLDASQQEAAMALFLRLVRLAGERPLREPMALGDVAATTRDVVDRFVEARMLTLTDGSVRISHDALLDHWARLRAWIEQSKADLAALSRLRRAAQLWIETGKDPGSLIPVQRLELFAGWMVDPAKRALLSAEEDAFLTASADHFASALEVERRTNQRLQRQRGGLIGLVALATALAMVVGLLYLQSQRNAEEAQSQRNLAQSRQVSIAAGTIRAQDPGLQAQMSLVASTLGNTREGVSALLDATSIDAPTRWLGAATSALGASPDGAVVVRANGDGHATLWRGDEVTTSPGVDFVVVQPASPVFSVAVTRRAGRYLAAFAGPDVRSLWDVTAEPHLVADLPRTADNTAYVVRFEPAGDRVAFGSADGSVEVFDLADPAKPTPTSRLRLDAEEGGVFPAVSSLAWGDGGLLVVGGATSGIARWRLGATETRLPDLPTLVDGLPTRVLGLAVNGSRLAAGMRGSALLRWTLAGDGATAQPATTGFRSWVNDVAFATDGSLLIAGSSDQTARLIDPSSGSVVRTLSGPSIVTGVALVSGRPVSAATDGALRIWPAAGPLLGAAASPIYNISSDAASTWLAAGSARDGIALWRGANHERVAVPPPTLEAEETQAGAVTVAPNGRYLLGGTRAGAVLAWSLDDRGATFRGRVEGLDGTAAYLNVSPDSSLAAAIAYGGTTTGIYRVDDVARPRLTATLPTPNPQLVCFDRTSTVVAVALADNRVELYSVADPAKPELIATLSGFPTAPISLSFSPATDRLAVGEDSGRVSLWDTSDPGNPTRVAELNDAHATAYGLAFSPDGQRLAAATADNVLWGWHLGDSNRVLWALTADIGRPWDVRFLDGGRRLAAAGDDGHVRLWLVDQAAATQEVCAARGTPLTDSEWLRYLPGIPRADPC